jgi:glycosyltransferase involved in cell wall biosynthesis
MKEDKNNKVLFVLQNLNGGGAEKVFVYLMNSLSAQGFSVELLLGKKEGVYFNLLNKNIKVHQLNASSIFQYLLKLRNFFKQTQYSHVVTASQNISIAFIVAKKIYGLKYTTVATLHYNLPVQLKLIKNKLSKWFSIVVNKKIITKADKIVAVSKGVAEGFSQITKLPINKISVIYNPAYDNLIYEKANEPIESEFEGLDYIISIGRFEHQKNQKLLLQAFALVKNQKPGLHLLILGEGTLKEELVQLATSLGINEKVHFIGFKDNPYKYLKNAKCFVLSSLYEGLPTVIIEALALGTNVVSTDCPSGPYELLNGGKIGWLSEINNKEQLASNVIQAINTPFSKEILINASKPYYVDNATEKYKAILT